MAQRKTKKAKSKGRAKRTPASRRTTRQTAKRGGRQRTAASGRAPARSQGAGAERRIAALEAENRTLRGRVADLEAQLAAGRSLPPAEPGDRTLPLDL